MSDNRPTSNLLARKGGLVVATPWDANMDAEQKLKGRVSVDQWMMATTARCQQQTGDGLAVSLPVHFPGRELKQLPRSEDNRHMSLF